MNDNAIKIIVPDMEILKVNKQVGGDLFILLRSDEYEEIQEKIGEENITLLERYGVVLDKEEYYD